MLEEVEDLLKWYPEVVDVLEEWRVEMECWASSRVVARSLGHKVVAKVVAHELWLPARLKGDVVRYGLERSFLLFRFMMAREWLARA